MNAKSLTPILAACCLVACATPRTSQGLIDTDGDGIGEQVTVIEHKQDAQTLRLHLQKVDARRKMFEIADIEAKQIKELYSAGRADMTKIAASENTAARAEIELIDAQIQLAESALLSIDEPTMLDSSGDGLPDILCQPIKVRELLSKKVELCQRIFDSAKVASANIENLHNAGRASTAEVHSVKQTMYEAKLAWIDARLQLERQK